MKRIENKAKPHWSNSWLNKNRIDMSSGDIHYSLVLNHCASNEIFVSDQRKDQYKTLLVTTEDKITKIILNRPNKKNAINLVMYREIMQALEEAAKDESTLTVITGSGDYYCSGNDLANFSENVPGAHSLWMKDFVSHFIDFPKPLVAVVNGPAIGISVTLLGLFDIVYASDKAMFQTPFSQLGLTPEGCSTYTFPKIMGPAKANEMLIFNKKITANQACVQGLVTEVFADSTFQKEVWTRLKEYAKLPKSSLAFSKQLIRSVNKDILHSVNSRECDQLVERCFSAECQNALTIFFQKKAKL